jgi:hypothetical protein
VRHLAQILGQNRSVIVLFVLVVLLPSSILTVLVVRTVRSERMRVKYEDAQRQRHIVRLAEADLNNWLFSAHAESAISQSLLRFQLKGDRILFPEFQLSLPNADAPRRRPFDSTPTETKLTADSITDQYYPRIQAFLRDFSAGRHSGAQYFLRLRAIVVRAPGRDEGYVLDVEPVIEHVNERLADFCATENFQAQGVGIGLALVKHVVDSHGGSVSVESQPGQGSCFRLRLPTVEV